MTWQRQTIVPTRTGIVEGVGRYSANAVKQPLPVIIVRAGAARLQRLAHEVQTFATWRAMHHRFGPAPNFDYLEKSCHADHRAPNDAFADGAGARIPSGVPSKVITRGIDGGSVWTT